MNHSNQIEEKINSTLSSIDSISRAEAPSFFETRLKARMEKELLPDTLSWYGFATKPMFAIAMLAVFIALNFATINSLQKDKATTSNELGSTNEASVQSFAQEYNLSVSTDYADTKSEQ